MAQDPTTPSATLTATELFPRIGTVAGNVERQTYTIVEAARVLGISRGNAYEAARLGTLPVLRLGRRLIVPRAALEAMLDGATVTSAVETRR